jgi:hypothetical protein
VAPYLRSLPARSDLHPRGGGAGAGDSRGDGGRAGRRQRMRCLDPVLAIRAAPLSQRGDGVEASSKVNVVRVASASRSCASSSFPRPLAAAHPPSPPCTGRNTPSSSSGRGTTASISGSPAAEVGRRSHTASGRPRLLPSLSHSRLLQSWRRSTEWRPPPTRLHLHSMLTSVPASAHQRSPMCAPGRRMHLRRSVGGSSRSAAQRGRGSKKTVGAVMCLCGSSRFHLRVIGAHGGTPLSFLFWAGANGHRWKRDGIRHTAGMLSLLGDGNLLSLCRKRVVCRWRSRCLLEMV